MNKFLTTLAVLSIFAADVASSEPRQVQPVQTISPPSTGVPMTVEVKGDWMFIGVPALFGTTFSGEVHIYRRIRGCTGSNCWAWHSRLTQVPAPVTTYDFFGVSIEYDGHTLFVGAPGDPGTNEGRLFVYERKGQQFNLAQVLTVPDADPGFGSRISLNGDQIAVTTVTFEHPGAVYLFRRTNDGWVFTDRVSTPNSANEQFGFSVDLQGRQLMVGANEGNYAVIFRRGKHGWREEQRITSPGTYSFGLAVEIRGEDAFVTSYGDVAISQFSRDARDWYLSNGYSMPLDPDSFPPTHYPGPLQMFGKKHLFAGGVRGVYRFEPSRDEWVIRTQYVTPGHVEFFTEDAMDTDGRTLGVNADGAIYVFEVDCR